MENTPQVPPTWDFKQNTRFSTSNREHPHFLRLPMTKNAFQKRSFFYRTGQLWNQLPTDNFPPTYDLEAFKRNVNKSL